MCAAVAGFVGVFYHSNRKPNGDMGQCQDWMVGEELSRVACGCWVVKEAVGTAQMEDRTQ